MFKDMIGQRRLSFSFVTTQGDTLRLMAAFDTNDTIDFFKGKIIHKSLFLMLVLSEEELKHPSVYHIHDLKVNDVSM